MHQSQRHYSRWDPSNGFEVRIESSDITITGYWWLKSAEWGKTESQPYHLIGFRNPSSEPLRATSPATLQVVGQSKCFEVKIESSEIGTDGH